MPRRRIVVTESVNGNPGVAWNPKSTSENVESPPDSPARQRSSSKSSSLRRSLSRTLSSLFRSSSSASVPSSPPAKHPVSPSSSQSPQSPMDPTAPVSNGSGSPHHSRHQPQAYNYHLQTQEPQGYTFQMQRKENENSTPQMQHRQATDDYDYNLQNQDSEGYTFQMQHKNPPNATRQTDHPEQQQKKRSQNSTPSEQPREWRDDYDYNLQNQDSEGYTFQMHHKNPPMAKPRQTLHTEQQKRPQTSIPLDQRKELTNDYDCSLQNQESEGYTFQMQHKNPPIVKVNETGHKDLQRKMSQNSSTHDQPQQLINDYDCSLQSQESEVHAYQIQHQNLPEASPQPNRQEHENNDSQNSTPRIQRRDLAQEFTYQLHLNESKIPAQHYKESQVSPVTTPQMQRQSSQNSTPTANRRQIPHDYNCNLQSQDGHGYTFQMQCKDVQSSTPQIQRQLSQGQNSQNSTPKLQHRELQSYSPHQQRRPSQNDSPQPQRRPVQPYHCHLQRHEPQGYTFQMQRLSSTPQQRRQQSHSYTPTTQRQRSMDYPPQKTRFSHMDQRKNSQDEPTCAEGSATLPRHYVKRQKSHGPQPIVIRRITHMRSEDPNRSASCTRIADMPDDLDGDCPVQSMGNVAEPSPVPNVQRRWHSVMNTANSRNSTLERKSESQFESGRLRFSSTFYRKSVGDELDSPLSPGHDEAFFGNDEVDASFEPRVHALSRHKSKSRNGSGGIRRLPSKVERKEAYQDRPRSMSASTGTLTRLSRKAPTAHLMDL